MQSKSAATLYTFGHSGHSIDVFIALLKRHHIERVVDVRGQPYSRRNPQFNRERLAGCLESKGIDYVWGGKHLSGRPAEARFYAPGGEVLWDELTRRPEFQEALDSLAAAAQSCRLALVCAEEDPTRCHRRFLLTPPLRKRDVEVLHLRGDGRVEPESAILERESATGKQPDLFE
ncbi:MAG TPA: DUF488 domain-containing protein [Gammaproteobacteria bacterium]|nr:DUF488 domain-containing protein [Gammaproteobacteria bacterium]